MTEIKLEQILNVPPARVWEEFQPRRLSAWYVGRPEVSFELAPRNRFLAEGDFKMWLKNGKEDELLSVYAHTLPRQATLKWHGDRGWEVTWTLESIEGGRTKLRVEEKSARPGGLAGFFAGMKRKKARRRYQTSLRLLKRFLA